MTAILAALSGPCVSLSLLVAGLSLVSLIVLYIRSLIRIAVLTEQLGYGRSQYKEIVAEMRGEANRVH